MMKQSSVENNRQSARERTWTDSSLTTGSFASYPLYQHHQGSDDTTTVSSSSGCDDDDDDDDIMSKHDPPPIPKTITPEKKRRDRVLLEQELLQARQEATEASEAFHGLIEGVRIITRQLKRIDSNKDADDDNIVATNVTAEDVQRPEKLMKSSVDLMALNDAAQFVSQHVSMASQEASVLVQDVSDANETCRKATERASEMEKQLQQLHLQNQELFDQIQQQKSERRVLVKQVKLLQKENTALSQKNMQQQQEKLELHISGALQVHEKLMAQQKGRRVHVNEDMTANVEQKSTVDSADDEVEAEGVVIEHSDSIKVEIADKPAGKISSGLGFGSAGVLGFGAKKSPTKNPWSAPTWKDKVRLAQEQQKKNENGGKENTVAQGITPKNMASYEPVKFVIVTPMSPERPSNQSPTEDLSPESGQKLFFRSSNTKRSLLELNSVPMLVGRSSAHVEAANEARFRAWSGDRYTPTNDGRGLPKHITAVQDDAESHGVSPLILDDGDSQTVSSSDDNAFRSLSLPRMTPTSSLSSKDSDKKKPPAEPKTEACPPEIQQIQQEIGALWEC